MEELRYVSKYTGERIDELLGKVEGMEGYVNDAAAMNAAIQKNTQAIGAEETRAKGAEADINERLDALGLYIDEDGDICQR